MAISYVGSGTAFTDTDSGTSFTINKPSGVASGDVMVAFVAFWVSGNTEESVTAPSGWTKRQTAFRDAGSDQLQLVMMTRTAGSSEPSSWSGSVGDTVYVIAAGVSAYRGVQTIGSSAKGTASSGTSVSTGSVTASVTGTWRVVCGAYFDDNASSTISSNESTRRTLVTSDAGSGATQGAIWDSNGSTVSGSTSRSVTRSSSWNVACAAILLLEPQTGTPATGTFSLSLKKVTESFSSEVHNDAELDIDLGSVTFDWTGSGQPPPAEGDLAVQLDGVSMDFSGGTDAVGSMNMLLPVQFEFVGETRAFGVRVIVVEYDKSRIIEVPSRAVDD